MVPLSKQIATHSTSLESEMELDNTLRLLVEVEAISRNFGMCGCLVEVALDHLQEVRLDVRSLLREEAVREHEGRQSLAEYVGEHFMSQDIILLADDLFAN